MTTNSPEPVATGLPSLPARAIGIIFSPRKTFEAVVAVPRPWGIFLLTTAVALVAGFLFLNTDVGRQAYVDQQVAGMESFGMTVDDAAYARLEGQAKYAGYIQAAAIAVMSPLMTLLVAAILFGIFSGLTGGRATFKQVLAVVTHSGAITILQSLFVTPLNYFRQSMSSPTNVGVFFPMIEEGSFIGSVLGTIDLFIVWWVIVLAIGLSVLYRRKTSSIAVALFGMYALIALGIAAFKSAVGGQ